MMELIKDYDCTIDHHPGKVNVVAYALSRKVTSSLVSVQVIRLPLLFKLKN